MKPLHGALRVAREKTFFATEFNTRCNLVYRPDPLPCDFGAFTQAAWKQARKVKAVVERTGLRNITLFLSPLRAQFPAETARIRADAFKLADKGLTPKFRIVAPGVSYTDPVNGTPLAFHTTHPDKRKRPMTAGNIHLFHLDQGDDPRGRIMIGYTDPTTETIGLGMAASILNDRPATVEKLYEKYARLMSPLQYAPSGEYFGEWVDGLKLLRFPRKEAVLFSPAPGAWMRIATQGNECPAEPRAHRAKRSKKPRSLMVGDYTAS